jgi:hypothetical protein
VPLVYVKHLPKTCSCRCLLTHTASLPRSFDATRPSWLAHRKQCILHHEYGLDSPELLTPTYHPHICGSPAHQLQVVCPSSLHTFTPVARSNVDKWCSRCLTKLTMANSAVHCEYWHSLFLTIRRIGTGLPYSSSEMSRSREGSRAREVRARMTYVMCQKWLTL